MKEVKRLRRKVKDIAREIPPPPCNHKLAFLVDPTEEEIRKAEEIHRNCPRCSKEKLMIIKFARYEQKREEAPREFTFKIDESGSLPEFSTTRNGDRIRIRPLHFDDA